MRRLSLLLAVSLLTLAAQVVLAQGGSVTVNMAAQNNSGEAGTATLTAQGNKTQVTVNLSGAPAGVAQPVHIHDGSCANLNPKPKYPLTSLMNGQSTTTLDVPLSTLTAGGMAINAHKSAQDIPTYVSCGDIRAAAAAPAIPRTGADSLGLGALALAGLAVASMGLALHRRLSRGA